MGKETQVFYSNFSAERRKKKLRSQITIKTKEEAKKNLILGSKFR